MVWDQASQDGTYSGTTGSGTGRFNHVPGGCNVLYLDGHVEFIKFLAKAPIQRNFAAFDAMVNDGN